MKNEKIVNAFNTIQPSGEVKNRVFSKVMSKQHKQRPRFKAAVSLATAAAVICLMVFGSMLLFPQNENIFTLKAYAMEQQADGSIVLREVDLHSETYHWISYNDGSLFYVNANLKCEGENIQSVVFYADDGFFAKQYLIIEDGKIVQEDGVSASYVKGPSDDDYTLLRYGTDFDIIGNSFTLESDVMTDNFLLFVGMEISDWRENPSQITIRAVATFNDGKTQEETITFDAANALSAGCVGVMPFDEMERMRADSIKHDELVHRIPLEQCEVVPGSVQTLTYGDTFEYQLGNSNLISGTASWLVTEESLNPANDWSLKRDEIGRAHV
jgi:hypothetical protein